MAIDVRGIRGASKQRSVSGPYQVVAAVDQSSGPVLGQWEVDPKSNEIPAVRQLAGQLDLQGRVVALVAILALNETARRLIEGCGPHHVFTAGKDNQPTIREDIRGMSFEDCPCFASC